MIVALLDRVIVKETYSNTPPREGFKSRAAMDCAGRGMA